MKQFFGAPHVTYMRVEEVPLGHKPSASSALEVCAKQSILYQDSVISQGCGECLQSSLPCIVSGIMIGLAIAALIYGAVCVASIFGIPRRAVGRFIQGFKILTLSKSRKTSNGVHKYCGAP